MCGFKKTLKIHDKILELKKDEENISMTKMYALFFMHFIYS